MQPTHDTARIETALPAAQLAELRDFALATAQEAAAHAAEWFGQVTAERKSDGSLVTQIDKECDRLITRRIHAAYPTHAVLSEEQDTVYDPAGAYTWVVDPIDGTTNFARGLPVWGVSIGLMYEGMTVVGALVFPLLREVFAAAHGLGAQSAGSPIASSAITLPDDESFVMTCTRTPRQYRLQTPLKARILGAAAYHLAKVADGAGMAAVEATPKIWDLAAADVILREAGGILEPIAGAGNIFPIPAKRHDYGQHSFPVIAAANRPIMTHLRSAFEG